MIVDFLRRKSEPLLPLLRAQILKITARFTVVSHSDIDIPASTLVRLLAPKQF